MPTDIPPQARELLVAQSKIIASRQGSAAGVDPRVMRGRAKSGRWQRLQRGVYAAFPATPHVRQCSGLRCSAPDRMPFSAIRRRPSDMA
jgi:hypothetical protein